MLSYKYNKKKLAHDPRLERINWNAVYRQPSRKVDTIGDCDTLKFSLGFLIHHFSTHFYNITFCPYPPWSPSIVWNWVWIPQQVLQQYVTNIVVQATTVCDKYCCPGHNST